MATIAAPLPLACDCPLACDFDQQGVRYLLLGGAVVCAKLKPLWRLELVRGNGEALQEIQKQG